MGSSLLPRERYQATVLPKTNVHNIHNGNGQENLLLESSECSKRNSAQLLMNDTPSSKRINLGFHDLTYEVLESRNTNLREAFSKDARPMKTIMHKVSGEFKSGELTAIMGPSGSGKTTLMSMLAGHKKNSGGTVLINGNPRNLSTFRKQSCYIMQDDVLLQYLTVMESMRFAAQLKLPIKSSKSQISHRISQILQTIGMYDCVDNRVANLSGGERKRLAIALELITNPNCMFFDEPTSGLDSSTCYSCVTLLRSLAHEGGRTIVVTIHQPSARIFELFDSLYLLADGHCLYQGPAKELVHFLDHQSLQCPLTYNPADFALDVASGEYGKDSVIHLREVTATLFKMARRDSKASSASAPNNGHTKYTNGNGNKLSSIEESSEEVTEADWKMRKSLHQFTILLRRSFLCVIRDSMLCRIRFVVAIVVAVFLGTIYMGHGKSAVNALNNCGGIFFQFIFLMYSSLVATILTFPLEREVVVREHLNCWYSLKTYYAARSLADIPFQIFFPFLFVCITYFMTGQPHDPFRFAIFCVMGLLLAMISQSVGMFFGSFCSIEACVFIAPISTIPIVLFNGMFTNLKTIPMYISWLAYVSYLRYTIQSAIYAVYGYDRADLPCDQPYCIFKDPKKILEAIDADGVDVYFNGLMAVVMLILIRIMTYFALKYKIASLSKQ